MIDLSEFYGMRVRIVLVLLREGAMTQTALTRELNANARVLKRHLRWLVENGIVNAYGSSITIYEPNPNHPIIKTLQELMELGNTRAPRQ